MSKKGMSKKRQRRLTLVGVVSVLAIWIAALALLFSQPGVQSNGKILPTLASGLQEVAMLPDTGAAVTPMSPTLLPTSLPVELPSESLVDTDLVAAPSNPVPEISPPQPTLLNIPDEPVPNSLVIRFKPEMTQQERLDYIASLGGQIVEEIKPLNTVIISLPANAAGIQSQSVAPGVLENEPDYYAGALYSPNDALAAGQWGLDVVKAPQAWDLLPLPTPGVTVAVIDSGICASHADLQGRITSNGWDFIDNDSAPQDEFGHGCAVSGIIAANSNNGLGIAGVAPNATVLPLRVLDAGGIGRYSDVAAAIVYAVDNGAGAINLSLGGPNPSAVLQDAVNYAEAHGVTVIAAAGNNGAEQVFYPAAYPAVVAVGSVSQNLQRSPFSNYGAGIDLYAPGDGIMTTSLDGSFQNYSGTSVAAPYVTGVWALRQAMGKALVLDGGIVSALYASDTPVPTEEPPSELCLLSDTQAAETAYFNLVQQNAAQPGSVAAEQIVAARATYLGLAEQCANALYDNNMTIDGGGISPFAGEISPLFQIFGTKWQQESPASPQIGAAFNQGQPPAEPGGIINFSFMPNNVSLAAKEVENGGGANAFVTDISDLPNNAQCDLKERIRQAFTAWGSVANVEFVEMTETGVVPFGGLGGVGDIRIGAQIIDGMRGELGHAYFPPPDPEIVTSTRSGDIFLDRSEVWGCAPSPEGVTPRVIDIGLVMLHELGHALGMQHERAAGVLALMNPTYNTGLITDAAGGTLSLTDGLKSDDQSGARAIYGGIGVSAPALQPVLDTDTDNTPTFPWRDTVISGSDYFEVQIVSSDNGLAGDTIFDGTTSGGVNPADPPAKSFTIPNTLQSLPYKWRVRAFDEGAWGVWSAYNDFAITVGIPALLNPTAGQVLNSGDIQFQWGQAGGATTYLLQIATQAEFTPESLVVDQTVAGTFFTPPTLADGTYYWRVQTGANPFSAVNSFRIDAAALVVDLSPGAPFASPIDGFDYTGAGANENITLQWAALDGVSEYQLQLDTSENFVGLLFLDKLFLDKLFLDKLFLDKLFLDKLFLDKLFLDKLQTSEELFLDKLFLDKLFLDKLFLDKLFLDKLFLDKLFLDKLFLDKLFLDKLFLDKLFLDKLFLDKIEYTGGATASLTFDNLPLSEGVHYWRVRPRLADGSFGPWSESRSFDVRTQATKVVINEIKLSDPSWIEFHNTGTESANMGGWQFFAYGPSGETQLLYTFPAGFTMQPGGYSVLYEGVGTDTDRALYTGGSQINWPLTAQGDSVTGETISEPGALNGFGTIAPALTTTEIQTTAVESASAQATSVPNLPTVIIGPNGELTAQGLPLPPLPLLEPVATVVSDVTSILEIGDVTAQEAFVIAIGDTVSDGVPAAGAGNLTPGGSDTYTFPATAGQIVYFDALAPFNPNFVWQLRSPSNVLLFSFFTNTDGDRQVLGETGTYTITVTSASATGTHSFKLWAVNDQTFPIAIGDTVSNGVPAAGAGNIESPGNEDRYTFAATAGQTLFFDAISATNSSVRWELRSPTNVALFNNFSSGTDGDRHTLTESGTYTIAYTAFADSTGTYSFRILPVVDQTFPIAIGDTVSNGVPAAGAGNIESPGNEDRYTFSGTAGQTLFFDAISATNSSVRWELRSPTNVALFNNFSSGTDGDRHTLTETGTYTIAYTAFADSTGTYSFRILPVVDQTFPIAIGDTVSNGVPAAGAGNIESPGNEDRYTFAATAGQTLFFDAISATNSSVRWELRSPTNVALFNNFSSGTDGDRHTLTETGTYTIAYTAFDSSTGTYSFRILPVVDQTFPIAIGDTVSNGVPAAGAGNIESPGNEDRYTFSGTAGQTLFFDAISATNSSVRWELRSPTNVALFNNFSSGTDGDRHTLTETGTYTIAYTAFADSTGTYSFRILPVVDQTFAINIGDLISNGVPAAGAGNIESPGNEDRYTFSGSAGQTLFFDAISATNSSVRWELRSPTNVALFNNFASSTDGGSHTLTETGTYTIAYTAFSDNTGTYSFRVSLSSSTEFAIAIGNTVSNNVPATGAGNITPAGNIDVYIFGGSAGQAISLDVLAGSAANLRWQLQDPSSAELFNTSFTDQNNISLPATGVYTLTVQASVENPTFTGTYSFHLLEVPVTQEFDINIGDTVSNGVPAAGAGNIETQAGEDVYTFTASAGQVVYFDAISTSNSSLAWRLESPSSTQIFDLFLTSAGGRRVLTQAGTYTLTAYGFNNSSGTYSFKLWAVIDHNFAINIGDTVSTTVPGAGSGNIEVPGAQDNYTFTVAAGQVVYFDAISSSNSNLAWELINPASTTLFDNFIDVDGGRRVLTEAGTYTVRAYSFLGSSGTYSFRLLNVEDDTFAINIGDTVSENVPGTGAGNIESQGAQDDYTFTVAAGQIVYLDAISSSNGNLAWQLLTPSSTSIFDNFIDVDGGRQVLTQAGMYTVRAYSYLGNTGTYSISLLNVADDTFAINIGDTVSNGVPAAGAGNIETLGTEDNYTFTIAAGQTIRFEGLNSSNSNISWRLRNPSSTQLFDLFLNGTDTQLTLADAGTYTLNVYGWSESTGTYSFRTTNLTESPQTGDTFTVNTTADTDDGVCGTLHCTLIEAINASNAQAGPNTIEMPSGLYVMSTVNDLTNGPNLLPSITSEITLNANGVTIERGGPVMRVFHVADGGNLTLNGADIAYGIAEELDEDFGGGMLILEGGVVTLNDVLFRGNVAVAGGGAVANFGTLTVNTSAFNVNQATSGAGGAIYNNGGTVSINDSLIYSNTALTNGGGLYDLNGDLTLQTITVENNQANRGGGLYLDNSVATITDGEITDNAAVLEGGAIFNQAADLTITISVITTNTSNSEQGGGVFNDSNSSLAIIDSTFSGNISNGNWGGGGVANYGELTVTGSVFSSNSAIGSSNGGGGILNRDTGTATIEQTEISGSGGMFGGGFLNHGVATVTQSSIHDNSGFDDGGGIYNAGTLTLTNTTVGENDASGDGGGLYNDFGATSIVTHATFHLNTAGGLGGNIRIHTGVGDLGSSIVSGGSAGSGPNLSGIITSLDYNVIQSTTGATIVGATANNTTGVSANLGTLTGLPGYYVPNTGSPAIDKIPAAACASVTEDQRGVARPQGANCDTGAIEVTVGDTPQPGPTFTVNTTATTDDGICGTLNCSLIEAINAANGLAGENTIDFALTFPAAITLNATLPTISTAIIIDGPGTSQLTVSGDDVVRVFHINSGGILTMDSLTVANGRATTLDGGGGLYNAGGTVTLANVLFDSNTTSSTQYGGAIFNQAGSLTVNNSTFNNNSADYGGGAIFNWKGGAAITSSVFSGNTAAVGAALHNYSPDGFLATLTVTGGEIGDNNADAEPGQGGAIMSEGTIGAAQLTVTGTNIHDNSGYQAGGIWVHSGTATLTNINLHDNSANTNGGGLYVSPNTTVTISGSTVGDNTASGEGGGLWSNGTVNVTNTTFLDNTASTGGAAANYGTMTVNTSTFSDNETTVNQGGAIANFNTITVDQSTFNDNVAALNGGALDNAAFGTATASATFTNSTLNNNTANGVGGALLNYAESASSTAILTVRNSTISGNLSIVGFGGGIANFGGGGTETINVEFSTLVSNEAVSNANLRNMPNKTVNVKNSITALPVSGANCGGVITSAGGNFMDDISCDGFTSVTAAELNLGALADNGGPTQTIALGTGSAAINAVTDCTTLVGAAVNTDQRGNARPQPVGGNCDAGAYEAAGAAAQPGPDFVVNNSTDVNDGVCSITNCSLREAIIAANAHPNLSVITFDFAPGSVTITLAGTELPAIVTDVTITSTPGRFNLSGNGQSRIFNVAATGTLTTNWLILINSSADTGGAILNAGTLNLVSTYLFGNVAGDGGAITNTGIATIQGSYLFSNLAFDDGGAIVNSGGTMTLENSSVFNNTTTSGLPGSLGGAIFNSGSLTIDGSTFTNNSTSNGSGGAVANIGELIVSSSTFSDENEAALGGALHTTGLAVMTLTNVTVSGNNATSGGGIYIDSPATINFSTIADNTGGGIYSDGVSYAIKNSIVADQQAGANCNGTGPSANGGNFTDDASCGGSFTNTSTPLIEGLAFNIGRVYTHALTETSPARDAAIDCTTASAIVVATDARDIARPQGPECDAGAYEFGGDLHVTTTQMIQDGTDGKCSLPEAIIAANTGVASGSGNGECVPPNSSPKIITLAPNQTYRLTQVDNTTQGPNGLPPITFNNLYLHMNGSTITRASDAPDFRIFYIAPGGLLYFTSDGTVSGGHLSGTDRGAGVLNQGTLYTGGVIFENNVAAGDGGALYTDVGATSNLFNNAFRNNLAGQGGALYNAGTVINNNGNLNRFEGNRATSNGGAVYNTSGTINLGYGIFLNNRADGAGGAVFNTASFTALNATFSGNQAAQGAALFNGSGTTELDFATIADNISTDSGAGAVQYGDGALNISNSIVANNPGGNCAGLPSSGSGNLQFPSATCGAAFTSANPLLAAKVDDTFLVYYPLLTGSPAIDAVSTVGCPNSDGRFFARPIGAACDTGSFEGVGIALTGDLTVTTTNPAANPTDGLCSLVEAIDAANSGNASGSTPGECVPTGGADTITLGTGLTYTLSTINNTLPPPNSSGNGLPAITSPITINANGSTITRSSEANFRIFYVNSDGSLTLNNVTLSNGFGDPGGAIFSDGSLTLNSSSIADNNGSSGGGLFLNGTSIINNSSITGNNGLSPDGGGIFVNGNATLTMTNSTVAGNSAASQGGGIVTGFGSNVAVQIINSTIANNAAAFGGGIDVFGGSVTVYNTIIANNTGGNCSGIVSDGAGSGSSIQWPGADCTDTITTVDPLLGPLTGSPAYLPLGTDSAAIDAANASICTASPVNGIDQRGIPRGVDGNGILNNPQVGDCDIGAIEITEAPALVPGTTGGAAALVSPLTTDFVRFGDTTLGPAIPTEWTGDNVAVTDSGDNNVTIGRDPSSSDTNHVTDWATQRPTEGGQNFSSVLINEIYTGSNDYVELFNPRAETANISGWELKLYDSADQLIPAAPGATYTVRFLDGTLIKPGAFLVVGEQNPGTGSNFVQTVTIDWDDANASGAVTLTNGLTPIDFVRFGSSQANQLVVEPPPGTVFTGIVQSPLPGESIGRSSLSEDANVAPDWYSQVRSAGAVNPAITPPANDAFTGATTIDAVPFRDTGDTTSASALNDPVLSCGASVGHTVWYKYTPTSTQTVRLQTDGSDFDTVLAVFTLNAVNTPVQLPGLCSQRGNTPTGSRLSFQANAGITYYILIGGQLNVSGQYLFSVNAPTNDDLFDAVNVGGLAALPFKTYSLNALNELVSNTNTTAASTLETDPAPTCAPSAGRSVWYSYNAFSATKLRLRTSGTQFDTVIAVYTGQRDGTALNRIVRDSLVEVACNNDDAGDTSSDLGFTPVTGTEYFFQVSGNSDQGGDLLFEVNVFPAPANDLIVNAYPVTKNAIGAFVVNIGGGSIVPTPFAEDTTGATSTDDPVAAPAEQCGVNPGSTVWFSYTADTLDTVVFQTFGSTYDTSLSIWTGDLLTPASLTQLFCNDDVSVNKDSRLTLGDIADGVVADVQVTVGITYYIGVSGYFGETGDLIFNAFTPQTTPPENDRVTTPFDITFNEDDGTYSVIGLPANETTPFMQDTTGAFPELVIPGLSPDGEADITVPTPTCGDDVGYTVWYRYAAPERQQIVFDAVGSDFDTVITAYVLQGDQLVEVGCNDDFEGRAQSKLSLNTDAGVTLYLLFGGFKRDRGNLDLVISQSISVTSFTLVDATDSLTNGASVVDPLVDGTVVLLSTLPDAISIRANTDPEEIGSVKFELSAGGSILLNTTDNTPPYALNGNNDATDGSYVPWIYTPNTLYTLKATPFAGLNANGRAGTPLTITFTISDNQPPVIDADTDPLVVSEGLGALNTGTFSDPDADTVTLSAAPVGTVTDQLDGTWEWSFPTTDGPAESQLITITADDGQPGGIDTVQFQLTVNNVAPTATLSSALIPPATARLTFSNQNDASSVDQAAGFTYSYDCDNDGTFDLLGTGLAEATFDCVYTVSGNYTARGRIADKDGGFTDSTVEIVIVIANQPPVADAGDVQTVIATRPTLTASVMLDGSGSSDSDGVIDSYIWTEGGTQIATGETATVDLPIGTHTITLTVTDNDLAQDTDEVIITVNPPPNTPPVADAGADQIVTDADKNGSELVTLDGSASTDVDGDNTILTYVWTEGGTQIATGKTAQVSLPGGTHTITLTVTDDLGVQDTDEVVVKVNAPPTANAGNDQSVSAGTNNVSLDGSLSSDTDGTIISYSWSENGVEFSTQVAPTITLPVGIHTLTLTVTDNNFATGMDTVIITVTAANVPPTANAGNDQTVTDSDNNGSQVVTLDGSLSSDSDGLIISYVWSENGNQIASGVTAPVTLNVGSHTITLTVTDDDNAPGTDTVVITVLPPSTDPITLDDQVELSSDDVNEDGNSYDATNPQLWFGTGRSVSKSFLGLRFNNLEIPKGAVITEAHIEVYTATSQWIRMRILIGAEAVDDSATFTSATRPSTRAFTAARLDYQSNAPWMGGTWNDIGDVKAIVQEIVNRPGWLPGNSLSILIKGLGTQWGRKFVTSYDGDPAHAPRLFVTYAGGPPPANNVPVVTVNQPIPPANEGALVNVTGTVTDADNNPVTLTASPGTVQLNGNTWTWSYTPPDGPATVPVTITATDSRNGIGSATFNLIVSNVVPTASFSAAPLSTFPNSPVTLTFSSPVDVATDLPGLIYTLDCGNGVAQTGAATGATCTYAATGTFTALGRITDKDGGYSDYQTTISITDTPTEPTTIAPQVNGSSDDVNEKAASFQVNNPTIWVGTEGSTNQSYTGLRFNNLGIPAGATITEAHLEFYVQNSQWIGVDVLIAADAADNSLTFTSGSRPSSRPLTVSRIEHHSNVAWTANTWNTLTGNLSGVVQEVVSRPGWQSGSSLSLILKGMGSSFGRKFVTSYDGNPAFAPRLVIQYTVPNEPAPLIIVPPPAPIILPTPPSAAFSSDITAGVAPLAVQFSNLSSGDIASYSWDFGDGGNSSDANPAHSFSGAGAFTVTLTVTGLDGTTSLVQAVINVTAPPPAIEIAPPPPIEEATPAPTEEVVVTSEPPPEATAAP